jgi:hypothetical protein
MEISNIILVSLVLFFTISSIKTVRKSKTISSTNNKIVCDADH